MNNYSYTDLLKNTSKDKINLLNDVAKHIKFNKYGKFRYFYAPYSDIKYINNFIDSLEVSSIYTAIPLISYDGRDEKPHLILSKQILLSKYSDPQTLNNYLNEQMEMASYDFYFDKEKFHYLIFKYKKIELVL